MTSPSSLCMGSHMLEDFELFSTIWTMRIFAKQMLSIFHQSQSTSPMQIVVPSRNIWNGKMEIRTKWEFRIRLRLWRIDTYKLTCDRTLSRTARKIPSTPKSTAKTTPGNGMCSINSITSSHKFIFIGLGMITRIDDQRVYWLISSINWFIYLRFCINYKKHRVVNIIWINVRNESIVLCLLPIFTQIGGSICEICHLKHFLVRNNPVVDLRIYGNTVCVIELS